MRAKPRNRAVSGLKAPGICPWGSWGLSSRAALGRENHVSMRQYHCPCRGFIKRALVVGLPALIVACMDQDAFAKCNQDSCLVCYCTCSESRRIIRLLQIRSWTCIATWLGQRHQVKLREKQLAYFWVRLQQSGRRVPKRNDGPVRPGGGRFLNAMWMYDVFPPLVSWIS